MNIADAIRNVTAIMQKAIDAGERSTHVDAHDLIEALLAVADTLDPPFGSPVDPEDACPQCGEKRSDRLVWRDDDTVRCASCGTTYQPGHKRP